MINDILKSAFVMLIENVIVFTIINYMLVVPPKKIIKQLLFSIPYALICSIIINFINLISLRYSYLISLIGLFFLIYILYKETLINKIMIYFFTYSLAIIIQITEIPFLIILHINTSIFAGLLFANIISMAITIIICKFIPLSRIYSFLISKDSILKILIVNSYIIIIAIVLYYKINSSDFIHSFILIAISTVLLIFVNSEMFMSKYKYQQQQLQLKAYIDYLPIINDLITHIREEQHDHNNHIQSMQMLPLTNTDYESLSTALLSQTKYMIDSTYSSDLLKINLKLICGFLISKCSESIANGKQLKINIKDFKLQSIVPEYELIDNSIEATDVDGISLLSIGSSQNKINIRTQNIGPLVNDKFCNSAFKNGYSTKTSEGNNHGIGLYKLKKMIDHYDGKIELSNEFDNKHTYIVFEVDV